MNTTGPPSAVLNAVLDTCSEIANYERYADAVKVAMPTNDCHLVARNMCVPDHHGHRIWVSEAMGQLCKAAASTYPRDVALHPDYLPWDAGVAVFEDPLFAVPEEIRDGKPEGPIRALQWATEDHGLGVFVTLWQGRDSSEPMNTIVPPLWPRAGWQFPFGDTTELINDGDENTYVLLSLWAMLRDRIALTETRRAPRPSFRRWERRFGGPPEDIIIVTLRRPESHQGEDLPGRSVDWTHQWIVDGHWRNQAYGPAQSLRRLQWIAPFIKGPEDKPLVVKDKVYAWTR